MKILVIPDIHLKPWMFDKATELMKDNVAEKVVCLMDIPDDWWQESNLNLYNETFNRAIQFQKEFQDTFWCYGNHDLCYIWDQRESGYSYAAAPLVRDKLKELQEVIPRKQLAYIQRIDDVLFLHGGLTKKFVKKYVSNDKYNDIDYVIQTINELGCDELWQDGSPIWHRPQFSAEEMYKPRRLLQIVGHTPSRTTQKSGNIISCDVFSTYRGGMPIGNQEFLVIDTETWRKNGF